MPSDLPVAAVLPRLKEALARHPAAVLAAPPGSGKTTLVPPALLDAFPGKIVMLEPRRLAARAAAARISELLGRRSAALPDIACAANRWSVPRPASRS